MVTLSFLVLVVGSRYFVSPPCLRFVWGGVYFLALKLVLCCAIIRARLHRWQWGECNILVILI